MTNFYQLIDQISSDQVKLVDLRSPSEFALGAMPTAINLPLFDDAERAEVGTVYKQIGKTQAIQLGLELIAHKLPQFLDGLHQTAGPQRKLYLHCWRGGMRSGSIAKLLRVTGVEATALVGGYKEYRKQTLQLIDDFARHSKLVLIGKTGSGKTELLRVLKHRQLPVIDLESLARHRGSAFGDIHIAEAQPTQQNFENQLALDYFRLKNHSLIAVEIEQNIGQIHMPAKLRTDIYASPMVLLERSLESRVARLVGEYAPLWNETTCNAFLERLEMLRHILSNEIYQEISGAIQRGELQLAARLILNHRYDRIYEKGIARRQLQIIERFDMNHDESRALDVISGYLSRPESWFQKIRTNQPPAGERYQ